MEKKEKKSTYKNRLKTDEGLERSRENVAEFDDASNAGKLIRDAFRTMIKTSAVASQRLIGRMHKLLMLVVKSDSTSDRGQRKISKGNLSQLNRFEFNSKASFSAVMYAKYSSTVDRVTGKLNVQFPAFIPKVSLSGCPGATHFRIITGVAELDFEKNSWNSTEARSEYIPYNNTEASAFNLEVSITPNSQQAFIQVLGVEYHQEVNGKMYLLKNDAKNGLCVIHAESAIV